MVPDPSALRDQAGNINERGGDKEWWGLQQTVECIIPSRDFRVHILISVQANQNVRRPLYSQCADSVLM